MSTHPSSTSSGVRALLVRMVADPSQTRAMHVAQFPASHEKGAWSPPRRAVSSNVSPGR